jgi:hypothetical protein
MIDAEAGLMGRIYDRKLRYLNHASSLFLFFVVSFLALGLLRRI